MPGISATPTMLHSWLGLSDGYSDASWLCRPLAAVSVAVAISWLAPV